jgi:tetratricopeptide (TPR) repeat protein
MRNSLAILFALSLIVVLGATSNEAQAQTDPFGPEFARMNARTKSGNEKLRNNDIDGALKDFNEAVLISDRFPNNVKSGTYMSRARARELKGDLDGALADLDKAILLHSTNIYAYQNRGKLYRTRKEFDKAISDYTRAIKLNPKFYFAYRDRGLLLLELSKDKEAEADFAKYVELNPEGKDALAKQIEAIKEKRDKKQ